MSALEQVATYPNNDWFGPHDKGKPWLDRAFFLQVIKLANEIKQNPANMLMVWSSESVWLRPWLTYDDVQPNSIAAGLTMLLIKDKADRTAYKTLSAADQVATKIRNQYLGYVAGGLRPMATAQTLYAYNAAPGVMKDRKGDGSNDAVLYTTASPGWEGVHVLDVNKNGALTIGDLRAWLLRIATAGRYKLIVSALNEVAAEQGLPPFAPDLGPDPVPETPVPTPFVVPEFPPVTPPVSTSSGLWWKIPTLAGLTYGGYKFVQAVRKEKLR